MIINLISGPRNVSTALMYSFAQRSDTRVVDEPFYALYLQKSGARHPGAEAVLGALSTDEPEIRRQLSAPSDKPVLFIKNMAHHMEVLADPVIEDATNIFLIRDPLKILTSYNEVISRPAMRDIGIAFQYELFLRLQEKGEEPVVMDSGFLLDQPEAVLKELCRRCGLSYDQRMAHWPAGPKSYDGVWAQYWYTSVHRSTGFYKQTTISRPLPASLKGLLHEAQSLYEKLLPFSVKA